MGRPAGHPHQVSAHYALFGLSPSGFIRALGLEAGEELYREWRDWRDEHGADWHAAVPGTPPPPGWERFS
jgi:hypothetical protein